MSFWSLLRRLVLGRSQKGSSQVSGRQNTQKMNPPIPDSQKALILEGLKQDYHLVQDYPTPKDLKVDELLVRTLVIGLNPIDWKAPDFNFGIPQLPHISGRELSGEVVKVRSSPSRWRAGDKVIVISTDYRDLRKAAYQEYVVAFDYNVARIPPQISVNQGATLGVAFVAAALGLGVCLGLDFSSIVGGPDLYRLVRDVDPESLPKDTRSECLDGISDGERAKSGDWIAVWGGSSTSANLTIQLARLAGLKVIAVVDKAKHGLTLSNHTVIRPDLLVDSHDPKRAVEIIRANTKGRLRFGLDTRGRDSAAALLQCLSPGAPEPPQANGRKTNGSLSTPPLTPEKPRHSSELVRAHLVGLTGLPKGETPEGAQLHTVPIKLFHEVRIVGLSMVTWLERLLAEGLLSPPDVIDVEEGLGNVNKGLDRMRRGEISGGKLVVKV